MYGDRALHVRGQDLECVQRARRTHDDAGIRLNSREPLSRPLDHEALIVYASTGGSLSKIPSLFDTCTQEEKAQRPGTRLIFIHSGKMSVTFQHVDDWFDAPKHNSTGTQALEHTLDIHVKERDIHMY